MKKESQNPIVPATPQNIQKISTTSSVRNQDQMPFLYMAMREPSEEYKNIPDSKKTLYRIIRIRNQS